MQTRLASKRIEKSTSRALIEYKQAVDVHNFFNEIKSKDIFHLLTRIPKGKVTSYKALAQKAGIKNPRLIGSIIHKNTNPNKYPCHRVIRSDRSIASGYAFGGKTAQIKLLKSEGVAFNKVDTKILPGFILRTIQ